MMGSGSCQPHNDANNGENMSYPSYICQQNNIQNLNSSRFCSYEKSIKNSDCYSQVNTNDWYAIKIHKFP